MGISMRNGVRLAAEQINAAGGVLGQKIELVERDDEASPDKGMRVVRDLVDKEKVVAVLGPINTAVADAAVGYGNEKHVPFIVNVSTGAKVNELFAQSPQNYVFRLAANDVVQTELVVRQAIDVRLHRSPAILCDDTGYGKSGLENLLAALGRRGIKPVYVGSFKLKDTDMTSQLRAARAAGADVLFSYGIGPELAAVALSMRRAGNTDGPAIKAALEDLRKTYDGVTGKYVKPYSAKDHEGLKESHVLLGRVKNGRVVPSWAY